MSKDTIRQLLVVLSVIVTITINILSNALPFNGQNTGEISDRFQVYFVPAGYVFAIWGLIYIGWIAYAIYQALPAQKNNPRLQNTAGWVVLGMVMNSAWLFFWHYNLFPLSLVAMLILLSTLIITYLGLREGQAVVSNGEKWTTRIPFSIYLGWITVATIANVTDVLNYLGWNGGPIQPQVWAVILLIAAIIITTTVLFTRRDTAYAWVIIWATIGIAVKQAAVPLVPTAAWITAGVVTLLTLYVLLQPLVNRAPAQASLKAR